MGEWVDPGTRWYEDFTVGTRCTTRGRTVDQGDITAFAGLTGDHYPLHTDLEYCKSTPFGERIAHGPLTFAFAVGLVGLSGFYGNAIEALLGIDGLRAKKPVKAGDTVHVQAEVIRQERRPGSRRGAITVAYSVRNQDGDEVMNFEQTMLAKGREEEK